MNRDLIFFSKQIISSRFRVLPAFGQVFDQWKTLEQPLTNRQEILKVIQVKQDLPVLIPFLTITPLTLLLNQPSGFIEISKTFGLGLAMTFSSLMILPLAALLSPKTCPSELQVAYNIPVLDNYRLKNKKILLEKILSSLDENRRGLIMKGLSTPQPNYISLSTQSTLKQLSTISKDLARYYGLLLPSFFTLPRLYQYIDWILTDDYLLSTQRPVLDTESLISALSARGYTTVNKSVGEMEGLLKDHLRVSEGLRREKMGVDDKVRVFSTLTIMALDKS